MALIILAFALWLAGTLITATWRRGLGALALACSIVVMTISIATTEPRQAAVCLDGGVGNCAFTVPASAFSASATWLIVGWGVWCLFWLIVTLAWRRRQERMS